MYSRDNNPSAIKESHSTTSTWARLYSDGIGIGQFNFRARHIPTNREYLLAHLSKEVVTAALLLCYLLQVEGRYCL